MIVDSNEELFWTRVRLSAPPPFFKGVRMTRPPCERCIVYSICYGKFKNKNYGGVTEFVWKENCPDSIEFTRDATQNQINRMRELFDLERIK